MCSASTLEPVERVEVVDRYTVKFVLKEPFVWLPNRLASTSGMWIIAPEVVEKFGDLKKAESAIGTGPFLLERYEPNVKTVFKRNPEYFLTGPALHRWGGVVGASTTNRPDWRCTAPGKSTVGQTTCGVCVRPTWSRCRRAIRSLMYRDYQSNVSSGITMRTDQPPFNDVRVRRAISHALDRQGIIEAVYLRGEATPALARGLIEWSLPVDQLGAGARYYQYDPKEARRLLAEAGYPKGFKTQLTATSGLGRDLVDAAQLVQRFLKDVGIEAELKLQEYGAYMATTAQGKYEGMVYGPISLALDPDGPLYGRFIPDHPHEPGLCQ